MNPTKIGYTLNYSDNSGIEYKVSYEEGDHEPITIEHIGNINWPISKLDWLINRLIDIRTHISIKEESHTVKTDEQWQLIIEKNMREDRYVCAGYIIEMVNAKIAEALKK